MAHYYYLPNLHQNDYKPAQEQLTSKNVSASGIKVFSAENFISKKWNFRAFHVELKSLRIFNANCFLLIAYWFKLRFYFLFKLNLYPIEWNNCLRKRNILIAFLTKSQFNLFSHIKVKYNSSYRHYNRDLATKTNIQYIRVSYKTPKRFIT